jgi:hypothetical protein
MNILFLDQFSTVGGGQRSLLELLPMVAQRGWKGHVADSLRRLHELEEGTSYCEIYVGKASDNTKNL